MGHLPRRRMCRALRRREPNSHRFGRNAEERWAINGGQMIRDPRNPEPNYMVRTESSHEFHANLRKTLVLLRIETKDAPIYFVVEGLSEWPKALDEMRESARYFYEEHTCPTNFIRIPLIAYAGNTDPHGLFAFVDAVWMMDEYTATKKDGEEKYYLAEVFPQLAMK